MSTEEDKKWRFAQCFGDKGDSDDITEGENIQQYIELGNNQNNHLPADIISAVEFDHTGDYLATGDKGGRVVLFERNDGVNKHGGTI